MLHKLNMRLASSEWLIFRLVAVSAISIVALTAISMVATPHWGDSSLSIDLTSDEISATGGHQRFALERFALLVSIDSLRSLPATQDSPPDYRFLRSPSFWRNPNCFCIVSINR